MARDFREHGVPLIRVAGLSGGRAVLTGCNYLDPRMVEAKWAHFRVTPGDTLLSTSASLGRVAVAGPEADGAIPYTGIIRMRPKGSRLLRSFIPYLLEGEGFQRQAEAAGSGSVLKHFGPSHLKTMTVMVPPVEEQTRIAWVLGAIDDKIDCNQRLATLLESVVTTAFRAHFVDFVGVEQFEDSEIGRIPRGWQPGFLSDLAEFVNGKAFTKDANGHGRPILRIKELKAGVSDATPWSDIETREEHIARHHDILFAWSGSLDVYRWSGSEALINQHIFKVIPRRYPAWFVLEWIRQHMPEFQAIARDKATTMGHIQRRHLTEAAVPIPDAEAIAKACEALDPLDGQHSVISAEIQTLAALRDALLPKLISAAIRVPNTADPGEVIGPAAQQVAA